jgi:transposase
LLIVDVWCGEWSLCDLPGLGVLLPDLADVEIDQTERSDGQLHLRAHVARDRMACPRCGALSDRVRGRYWRHLVDAPVGGRRVVLDLRVRQFRCEQPGCKATFAEQVEGLTRPYARFTPAAEGMLAAVGLALAGRAGCRLCGTLGLPAGRDTLLRRVRALPDPDVGTVTRLGVDDFALRRRTRYGTLLLDLDTGAVLDLLDGRDGAPVTAWLTEHPGVKVVCRDRAAAYGAAVREGAPEATQVADRWHLFHNLCDDTLHEVARHRGDLRPPVAAPTPADPPGTGDPAPAGSPAEQPDPVEAWVEPPAVRHARERFTEVQALKAQGLHQAEIARRTGLARPTVRKYFHATALEDVHLRGFEPRASALDPYRPYLYEHFRPGVTTNDALFHEVRDRGYTGSSRTVARYLATLRPDQPNTDPVDRDSPRLLNPYKDYLRQRFRPGISIATLTAEIIERGYTGCSRTVARYLATLRPANPPTPRTRGTDGPAPPPVPKARDIASWILTRPDHLTAEDTAALDAACVVSPPLATLRGYVACFAQMLTDRTGQANLDAWLDAVEADDLADLRHFARGVRRDYDAVLAGLTLPDSSGTVEGNVNKLKLLKRQMYGRAKLDLLRKRVLLQ